ncbi:hypothetical protein BRARA_H00638 [Brassica rapa]|uniref:Uncharacterized protein n=1 Tax=Brassica campestris TaxID=3711 RepID=A0A397Y8P8_BRACM|nr:hypothetical protein BRARA_H00638 [Brassica rapa]
MKPIPGDPVLDIDGNIIFNGSYYILSHMVGTGGGGLTLSILPSKWWLYVAQETSEANRGFSVRFSDWRSTVKFVLESAHINIQMVVNATVTTQPTYWTLNIPLKILEAGIVAVGPKPLSHYFQIQKIEDSLGGYKIVFCWSSGSCTDLGIHPDRYGVRRLQFSSTPHEVVFMRAPETETSSKTMSII